MEDKRQILTIHHMTDSDHIRVMTVFFFCGIQMPRCTQMLGSNDTHRSVTS